MSFITVIIGMRENGFCGTFLILNFLSWLKCYYYNTYSSSNIINLYISFTFWFSSYRYLSTFNVLADGKMWSPSHQPSKFLYCCAANVCNVTLTVCYLIDIVLHFLYYCPHLFGMYIYFLELVPLFAAKEMCSVCMQLT